MPREHTGSWAQGRSCRLLPGLATLCRRTGSTSMCVPSSPHVGPDALTEARQIGQKDHERSGEYVCSIKGTDESKRNMNVHRADLLDQLIALVPSEVSHFDRRCSAYTPLDDGRVELTFSAKTGQEERTTVDVAIAADGIKSAVRRSMYERLGLDLESQAARYAEWIAWRGLVPRATFEEAMGKGAEVKMMHMGEGRHMYVTQSLTRKS